LAWNEFLTCLHEYLLMLLLLLLGGGLWTSGRKETADIDSIAIHWM